MLVEAPITLRCSERLLHIRGEGETSTAVQTVVPSIRYRVWWGGVKRVAFSREPGLSPERES